VADDPSGKEKLKETLMGMESPVRQSERPPPDPPPAESTVDSTKLLEAWQLNVSTMRSLIEHLDAAQLDNAQTRSDNKTTRWLTLSAAAVVVVIGAVVLWRVETASQSVGVLTAAAQAADAELDTVRDQLSAVLTAVQATNEAELEEELAAAVSDADAHPPLEAPAPKVAAIKARVEAQVASIQAEKKMAESAPTAPEKKTRLERVRRKAKALKAKAAKMPVPLDGGEDSPLRALDDF